MAHEGPGPGRPLHSGGTDGRGSSALGRTSPTRERKVSAKNGDGTDFPRYFLQLGQDFKRTRGYQMIQELQLMVCNKESGIKGNAARARVMVLLREVQSVLVGLENKIDAQTYEMGVFNVERSELRKELRDEKSKEVQPLHTIDFRSTEVKDLPHKLRTLFEDNQVLREQVRSLQYAVRNGEAKLEAANQRLMEMEAENANLSMALREAGLSPDLALEMRHLREAARTAEARVRHAEMQAMALQEQLEMERRMLSQHQRHHAARQAMLEARLNSALGVTPATSRGPMGPSGGVSGPGGGGGGGGLGSAANSAIGVGRKTSGRMGLYDSSSAGGGTGGGGVPFGYDDGGMYAASFGTMGPAGALLASPAASASQNIPLYGIPSLLADGGGGGGYGTGLGTMDGRLSAHSKGPSLGASGGAGGAGGPATLSARGGGGSGRDQPTSPPRSPSGKSISHSPGSVIPSLYPLFNSKPRATHAFTPESTSWLMSTYGSGTGTGSVGPGGAGSSKDAPQGSLSSGGHVSLPPPPTLGRTPSVSERLVASAGPMGRSGSGLAGAGGSGQGLELLPPATADGTSLPYRPPSSASASGAPGEAVRAINSTAVVTSRPLLPSVSRSSAASGTATGGPGGVSAGGPGILGLRTMLGGGPGSMLRRSSDQHSGGLVGAAAGDGGVGRSGSMQALSPDPAVAAPSVASESLPAVAVAVEEATPAEDEVAGGREADGEGGAVAAEAEAEAASQQQEGVVEEAREEEEEQVQDGEGDEAQPAQVERPGQVGDDAEVGSAGGGD